MTNNHSRLTPTEARIYAALSARPGAVVPIEQLLEMMTTSDNVRVHISRLRRKIPGRIISVPQLGYRLVDV